MKFLIGRATIYKGRFYHEGEIVEGDKQFIDPLIKASVGKVLQEKRKTKKQTEKEE